ncbi:MAG TPA: acyl carrier protein [Clostridia bacterium]|nr:acyl carrier protein [Clostridia bacterium]
MVFEKVRDMLAEYKSVDASTIKPETTLEELKLDSLDTVQIVMDLEAEFNITLETDAQIKTVGEIVALIESKL